MTVAELIERLKEYPGKLEVVLAKDAEGNSFSPLDELDPGTYEPISTWRGEFDGEVSDENQGYFPGIYSNALCLWPVN